MTRASLVLLAGVVACGGLFGSGGDSSHRPLPVAQPTCPHDEHATIELVTQVEACEARLKVVEQAPPSPEVVRVHVPGPPKKCADTNPKIAPVVMSQCQPGMVCLDSSAKLVLINNLLEYESWVQKVQACERDDKESK